MVPGAGTRSIRRPAVRMLATNTAASGRATSPPGTPDALLVGEVMALGSVRALARIPVVMPGRAKLVLMARQPVLPGGGCQVLTGPCPGRCRQAGALRGTARAARVTCRGVADPALPGTDLRPDTDLRPASGR